MGSLEAEFERTILSFKNRLEQKELVEMECRSLSDLYVVINRIQHQQRDLKKMMNLNRIKSFLEAMAQFEQTIKIFANVNDKVAFIWGPIKFLLDVASTWADAFDELLDAYERIGESIPLLQQYQGLFRESPHMQKVLNMIFDDILRFHAQAIRFFAKKVWKQLFRSLWKDNKTRFQHLLEALERHGRLIQEQATVLQFRQYQDDRAHAQIEFEKADTARRLAMQRDVLHWLSSNDNIISYEAACEARQTCPESGKWLLSHHKVQDWKDVSVPVDPFLWLNGIPGAGKSVLASVIIENCLKSEEAEAHSTFTTVYFYCTRSYSDTTSCIGVLRGLIAQLLVKTPDLLPFCFEKYTKSGETILTSVQLAKQLFEIFCESNAKLRLIVDGLDECPETDRKALLRLLTTMIEETASTTSGKLRVLIVSQQYNDIRILLSSAVTLTVELEHNGEDIRNYVDYRMTAIAERFDLDERMKTMVAELIYIRSSGMFLFAELVLKNLRDQPTKKDFLTEISKDVFPTDLQSAYTRILNRIKTATAGVEALWAAAVKLLGWMACARRPMRWHEIQAAASIDPENESLSFDAKKFRRDHAQDLCGALILELPGKRLTLVHSTARQYIVQNEFITLFEVERNLTTLCLQYLTFPSFDLETPENELRDLVRRGQLAFHEYAIANWTIHFLEFIAASAKLADGDAKVDSACSSPGAQSSTLVWERSNVKTMDLTEFESAVEDFKEFFLQQCKDVSDAAAAHECRAFAHSEYYNEIRQIWELSKQYSIAALETRNKPCIDSMEQALCRGQKTIEDVSASLKPSAPGYLSLDEYYGTTRFKCPKVTCHWFHLGFDNAKIRKAHVARHERPFRCDVSDCSGADMGFINAKALEKHVRMFHPSLADQAESFTTLKPVPDKTPYACHLCPKRFTRNINLRSHIRNHNQERPYACAECGKDFTRLNDCRRHERTVHSNRA